MLAFTFPGQGSQRSGMGNAWLEHPSWEVAAEASEVAGRDLTALLLDAPMEELTRTANAQLATFVMSLVVLDAVERLGLAPAATRRPQSRGVHGAGCGRRAVGARRDPPGRRAGRGHAGRRRRAAGHHGRAHRHRGRRRPGRLPAGRGRRLGRQLQRPRPGGHRRDRAGHRRGGRAGQGARDEEGPPHPGVGRVPHPADAPRPWATPRDARHRRVPRDRRFRSSPMSTPASTPIRASGPASSPRSCAARSAGVSRSKPSAKWAPRWSSRSDRAAS